MTLDSIIWIHALNIKLMVMCSYGSSQTLQFGLKELLPNHSQGKPISRLGPDQVQWLGPPTSLHDINYYALFEYE